MKTFELSEEFILSAHKSACSDWKQRIEKEVPELFKSKLEVGKWFRNKKALRFIEAFHETKVKGYGFGINGTDWQDSDLKTTGYYGHKNDDNWTPATDEEVQSALIAEAKKRYGNLLKVGAQVKGHWGETVMTMTEKSGFYYLSNDKVLGVNGVALLCEGKWATIITPVKKYTLTELENLVGHEFEIVNP